MRYLLTIIKGLAAGVAVISLGLFTLSEMVPNMLAYPILYFWTTGVAGGSVCCLLANK